MILKVTLYMCYLQLYIIKLLFYLETALRIIIILKLYKTDSSLGKVDPDKLLNQEKTTHCIIFKILWTFSSQICIFSNKIGPH